MPRTVSALKPPQSYGAKSQDRTTRNSGSLSQLEQAGIFDVLQPADATAQHRDEEALFERIIISEDKSTQVHTSV
jgi:hypothetical protein